MKHKWFRSNILVYSVISALILMTSAPAFPLSEDAEGKSAKSPVVRIKGPGGGLDAAQERNCTLLMEDGHESGSYPIPDPYNSVNQRSLCNKCHVKDVGDHIADNGS